MRQTILDTIRALLDENGVAYRLAHHEPTRTSEESARARGEDIRVGGKALLMKIGTGDDFRLFVISAARQLDSRAIKQHFGVKRMRFATAEELHELTGLVPGCVPPFGRPILPFDLYADTSVIENDRIAFNAGSLTDSIIMPLADWQRLAQPTVFTYSR